jgi:hypothetical protein
MKYLDRLKYAWIFILCLVVTSPLTACAKSSQKYSNQEFGFNLAYPESWVTGPALAPNSRLQIMAPANTQRAECNVIVKRYPKAVSAQQGDIDQVFLEVPSVSELKEILSQSANDVEVLAASSVKLHSRPAHLARVRYNVGSSTGKTFVSGRVLMTATPGLTWTLSCGGQGNTPAEAEKSYQFWQHEIDNTVSSFRFK